MLHSVLACRLFLDAVYIAFICLIILKNIAQVPTNCSFFFLFLFLNFNTSSVLPGGLTVTKNT